MAWRLPPKQQGPLWALRSRVVGTGHDSATSQHHGNGEKDSSRSLLEIETQHAFAPNDWDL